MTDYIDGFFFPIARDRVEEYQPIAKAIAEIYKEHGALDYREYIGDAMSLEGTRSFVDAAAANENEAIVFGWAVFESRESRDLVNEKISKDPRMADLCAPIMDPQNPVFQPERMAYAGFAPLLRMGE